MIEFPKPILDQKGLKKLILLKCLNIINEYLDN